MCEAWFEQERYTSTMNVHGSRLPLDCDESGHPHLLGIRTE